jgi:drug/metabolite transporter (DMT)-like permease
MMGSTTSNSNNEMNQIQGEINTDDHNEGLITSQQLTASSSSPQSPSEVSAAATTATLPKSPLLVRTLSLISGGHPDDEHPHSLVGILLITLGAFSFSCMFLFVKFMQGKANSFTLAFYRALVEIPIALYLCNQDHESPLGPQSKRAWLWVRGGVGGAAVLCFFYAIQHMPLPDAVTLQFTTPPFAAAFAVVLANEPWQKLDMWGAVVCLLGVGLIAHPSWLFGGGGSNSTSTSDNDDESKSSTSGSVPSSPPEQDYVAIGVALLGAAFAGLAYMSVRKIGHVASANVMVLYYSVLSMPLTVIGSRGLVGTWNVWSGGRTLTGGDWGWMLCTGIAAYTGQYLTNLGLQLETAATGTLATCSQIVFTYLFELLFLHETINLWSIAGTVLIVGFMVWVGIIKMK